MHSLDDAGVYFSEVVEPTATEFFGTPSSFRTALALATVLFHAHEWLWEFNRTDLEAEFSTAFPSAWKWWKFVEAQVPEARFIRDLANASKHVRLTLKPSTSMTHIANTSIQSTGFGEGGFGAGRYGGGPNVTMKDGADDVSFDDCANNLLAFWRPLVAKLYA